METIFTGVATAVVTPFKKNYEIDYKALKTLIEFNVKNKVKAMLWKQELKT